MIEWIELKSTPNVIHYQHQPIVPKKVSIYASPTETANRR